MRYGVVWDFISNLFNWRFFFNVLFVTSRHVKTNGPRRHDFIISLFLLCRFLWLLIRNLTTTE